MITTSPRNESSDGFPDEPVGGNVKKSGSEFDLKPGAGPLHHTRRGRTIVGTAMYGHSKTRNHPDHRPTRACTTTCLSDQILWDTENAERFSDLCRRTLVLCADGQPCPLATMGQILLVSSERGSGHPSDTA